VCGTKRTRLVWGRRTWRVWVQEDEDSDGAGARVAQGLGGFGPGAPQ
jgi:hypothetical protein